jgi:hypothetical protein
LLGKHAILLALNYVHDKRADPEVGQTSSFEQTAEGSAGLIAGLSSPDRRNEQPTLLLHAGPICQGWLSELQRDEARHVGGDAQ